MIRNQRSLVDTGAFALIEAYSAKTAKRGRRSLFTSGSDLRLADTPNARARVLEFKLPGLTLGYVQSTGHSVTVREGGSFTVLLPLRGMISSRTRRGEYSGTVGSILAFPPSRRETKVEPEAQRGFEALVLVIPNERLRQAARSRNPQGADGLDDMPPRVFGSTEDATAAALTQLAGLLASDVSARAPSIQTREGLASWEHLLLSKLTELLLVDRSPWSRPRSQKQIVARAMAYIQTHYAGIHAIADVANACGVSIRTLESAFQSEVDQTPSEALRNCRLEEARRKIMHDRDRGITEIALACGFNHLGRFSGAYRSRFGILPSAEQAGAAEAAGGSSSSDIG